MTCAVCASELPRGALFCGECGSSVSAEPRAAVVDQRASDTSVLAAAVAAAQPEPAVDVAQPRTAVAAAQFDPTVAAAQPESIADEFRRSGAGWNDRPEQVRIQPPAMSTAYLLRFSTGETAAISGAGLIGRKPAAQPGEEIPTLIPISDEERSVSKTHLEVGVSEGRMWVSDRFSANGSMRIEPGGYQRRLEPGRRYLIESGTRIAIGEQWVEFVLPEQFG